jgi:hypothetical protein
VTKPSYLVATKYSIILCSNNQCTLLLTGLAHLNVFVQYAINSIFVGFDTR